MKYIHIFDPNKPNWFDVADNIASGGWNVAEACKVTGRSLDQLKFEMMRLGANLQGKNVVAAMATDALNKIEAAEKATPKSNYEPGPGTPEPMPPPMGVEAGAANVGPLVGKSGAGLGRLPVSKFVGVAFGVVVVAAGANYARNANRGASLAAGVPAPVPAPATAGAATAPSSLICTRGEAIVAQMGRELRPAGDSVTFQDPDSQIANTISWQAPAVSLRVGDDLPLESWSTHNGGRPMEVQWESGPGSAPAWGFGASSKTEFANEGRKITPLSFRGGSVRLIGGVNGGSADQRFRIQWDYYCKS